MNDYWVLAVASIAVIVFFALLGIPAYYLEKATCRAKTQGIGESQYTLLGGCMVKPEDEDGFIPLENYRVM